MFTPALLDDESTVHAEAAREMVLNNDWVTLHANGIRYLEGPCSSIGALLQVIALSVSKVGILEHTAAPHAGCFGLLLATYILGTQAYGERAACARAWSCLPRWGRTCLRDS